MKPERRISILLALTLAMSGCAYSYLDKSGAQHVVGLVSLTMEPSREPQTFAGNVSVIRTIGIVSNSDPLSKTIAVGYNQQTLAYLRNNVAVTGDALHPEFQQGRNDE